MNSSRAPLQAVADRWNLFFFARRSMPIAGVIRICYGALLLINMLCLAPYLELWFTEAGPIPLPAARAILASRSCSYRSCV